jgi:hypothetical protein
MNVHEHWICFLKKFNLANEEESRLVWPQYIMHMLNIGDTDYMYYSFYRPYLEVNKSIQSE